jgi:muramoyltetrapeptide carboxypeptidase
LTITASGIIPDPPMPQKKYDFGSLMRRAIAVIGNDGKWELRMAGAVKRIAVVAPSCTVDTALPAQLDAVARAYLGAATPEITFHPQCFLSEGHFAGPDAARADALVEVANDPSFDAVWFARGGYGACRMAENAIGRMGEAARAKAYLGYSDAGFLLAGLYARGIGRVAHGPMPSGLHRDGGDDAVRRALDWLLNPDARPDTSGSATGGINLSPPLYSQAGAPKQAAFNITVLSQLLGTPLQPDLTDHVLMLEEVDEYMYRIDRSLFHITSSKMIRQVAGIKLGRCSAIPDNDPDFVLGPEAVVRHWCNVSGIAYLGTADIGHDVGNKVVPFG